MAFWSKTTDGERDGYEELPKLSEQDKQSSVVTKASSLEEELLRRFGRIRSALSPGTVIQGKLSFDSAVRIDGKLSGEVFSSQTLLIGATGQVDASIEAETVVVLGKLKGNLKAKARVEVFPGAEVQASIMAPTLVVHEGAFIQGQCQMTSKKS